MSCGFRTKCVSARKTPRSINGRAAAHGKRQPADQRYESAYLFGALCPARDTGAALVLPVANTKAMAHHLAEISATVAPGAHAIILLDQAGWHTTAKLDVPHNLSLVCIPPATPELNPAENVRQYLRQTYLGNRVFKDYDDIIERVCQAWRALLAEPGRIESITARDWARVGQYFLTVGHSRNRVNLVHYRAVGRPYRKRYHCNHYGP